MHDTQVSRILQWGLTALVCSWILYQCFNNHYQQGVSIPLGDEFSENLFSLIEILEEDKIWDKFLLLFSQHNTHIVFFNRLAAIVSYGIFGYSNFYAIALVSATLLLPTAYILWRLVDQNKSQPLLMLIPFSLLFSNALWQSHYWSVGLCLTLSVFFPVLAVFLITKNSSIFFAVALLLLMVIPYTLANGMLFCLLCILFCFIYRMPFKRNFIFAGFSILSVMTFFSIYSPAEANGSIWSAMDLFTLEKILRIAFCALGVLGQAIFPFKSPEMFAFIAGLFLVAGLILSIFDKHDVPAQALLILLYMFVSIGAAVTTRVIQEVPFGVYDQHYSLVSAIAISIVLMILGSQANSKFLQIPLVFATLFVSYYSGSSFKSDFSEYREQRHTAIADWAATGQHPAGYQYTDLPFTELILLGAYQKGIYNPFLHIKSWDKVSTTTNAQCTKTSMPAANAIQVNIPASAIAARIPFDKIEKDIVDISPCNNGKAVPPFFIHDNAIYLEKQFIHNTAYPFAATTGSGEIIEFSVEANMEKNRTHPTCQKIEHSEFDAGIMKWEPTAWVFSTFCKQNVLE